MLFACVTVRLVSQPVVRFVVFFALSATVALWTECRPKVAFRIELRRGLLTGEMPLRELAPLRSLVLSSFQ